MKLLLKRKWIRWAIIVGFAVVGFFAIVYVSVFLGVFGKLPSRAELSSISQAEATQLLDKDGKLIGKFYIYDRQPLEFHDLPQHLIDALVATEDVRFYKHDGVDNVSLLRVFIKNIILGDKSAGGGSTITLQLAKNLFGRKDYVLFSMLINKFKESIIAKRIEDIYSKNNILTLYFNTVPFPDNTFGIESASRKFFNKPAKDLNYSEAAALIGTLKATSYYNPRLHLERTQSRRDVVLQQMHKYDYLTEAEADSLSAEALVLNYKSFNHDIGLAPYFRESVRKELKKILDSLKKSSGETYDLYRDGLVVHTTLDSSMQALAEASMKEHLSSLQRVHEQSYGKYAPWHDKKIVNKAIKSLPAYKRYKNQGLSEKQILDSLAIKRKTELFQWTGDTVENVSTIDSLKHSLKLLNTGMLAIDPQTGAVRTYIGGIDYRFFKYDHVSQSERQVGSTFKPFVYTAAIEDGMKPCTYFSLSAVTYTDFDDWTPTNSGKEENDAHLNYNLETALSQSVNTIAVKVLNKVGIEKVIAQAEKMGIEKKLPEEPSLALGVAEINLRELTGAYASYVNDSRPVRPFAITKITDKNGDVIVAFKPEIKEEQAYSDYTREVMLQIMQSTVNSGTATRLRSSYNLKNDIAGKTGTTQNNKDGWFVGITPKLVTVTWVGNDNHSIGFKTTGIGQGANSALPIFAKFYQKLNADSQFNSITKAQFQTPSDAVLEDLDCEPEKRDGFFKRLFGNKTKERRFKRK
ncbi:transglycosylase domain-containing protein [Aestuariibaculum sediminum]|uniref:Transglycosylase domain-containing protein n=1 Tax=Aestuariibaculum sediminum TaxID=2770637 RepID=A0A8J6Q6R9_9FLAO|nr:transglycosylase domain-containing protein [Aestuariibaculum sediminum]MBD0831035.1 transglycosylase domain-containing protein [Aestuariibaculum sediminum]